MRMILADIRGGLAIINAAPLAVGIYVLFAMATNLALEAQVERLSEQVLVGWSSTFGNAMTYVLTGLPQIIVGMLLALFMIEIAAHGAERCMGRANRMQLVFRPHVAWAVFCSGLMSLIVGMLIILPLIVVQIVVMAFFVRDDGINLASVVVLGLGVILLWGGVAFATSLYALIPIIARHHGLAFREAWRYQTERLDHYFRGARKRFFMNFLVLMFSIMAVSFVISKIFGGSSFVLILTGHILDSLVGMLSICVLTYLVVNEPELASGDGGNGGETVPVNS